MRYSSALSGAVLCVAVLAACGRSGAFPGEGPNGCVRSPTTLSIAPKSGATLTVKLGALTAPIAQAWKRVKPVRRRGLHPYRATVIVAR
jgi:hypothetical protein